jgi:hypothetical protein
MTIEDPSTQTASGSTTSATSTADTIPGGSNGNQGVDSHTGSTTAGSASTATSASGSSSTASSNGGFSQGDSSSTKSDAPTNAKVLGWSAAAGVMVLGLMIAL